MAAKREKGDRILVPVVKWVGGKRQLLRALDPLLPERIGIYCEPFVGGGAMLFHLQPEQAYVNDVNAELINLYEVIRDDVDGLLRELSAFTNDRECFYAVRDWDRDPESYAQISRVRRAARIVYLNKTCYNGLFRVNSAGEFNTPFGRYKNPGIVDEEGLRAVHRYFARADLRFFCGDYAQVLDLLPPGAFAYLDPPYDPVSDTANFTGYAKSGFGREEQIRLRECCDKLTARGVRFMLSNSATAFIREQYANYRITVVNARRAVNSNASKRGCVEEVVIRNYE